MHGKYANNFIQSNFDPGDLITDWKIDKESIQFWVNLKEASMIFVPVVDDKISHVYYYCSNCKRWFSINGSVKNIKRHVRTHIKNFQSVGNSNQCNNLNVFSEVQEDLIIEKIVLFILLDTQTFQYADNIYLNSLTKRLPNRKKITNILEKLSELTMNEIKSSIMFSSSNSITFDGWSSKNNLSYIGITIRSLINNQYKDYFLDLVELTSDSTAPELALQISISLQKYGITLDNVVSCTTDNCPVMNATAKELNLLRIPCVCHMLNLIFQTFVDECKSEINTFLELIAYLNRSTKYTAFVKSNKLQKVPSYIEIRWTSLCKSILSLLQNKENIVDFCIQVGYVAPTYSQWEKLSILKELSKRYIEIMTFFEGDEFGASGFFLLYIDVIIDQFKSLENTIFESAARKARKKIDELKELHSTFWEVLSPMALLLNPILPFKVLLKKQEIKRAKAGILTRMKKYSFLHINSAQNQHDSYLNKYFTDENQEKKAPLEKILDERDLEFDTTVLKNFWFDKLKTSDKALACVAVDLLGMVITSVSSERSFSRGRLIINDQRTKISSEHACQQMIVQINKESVKNVIERSNIQEIIK